MKDVVFLIKSLETPSSQIRVVNMLPYLENQGISFDLKIIPNTHREKMNLFRTVSNYKIVYLQKRLLRFREFRTVRRHSECLIYDFDDAVFLKDSAPSNNSDDYRSFTRKRLFARTAKNADFIVVANNVLKSKSLEYLPEEKIRIIPSAVDMSETVLKRDYKLHNPVLLGWIGSKSTLRYLHFIRPALLKLRERYPFKLKIIADREIELEGIYTEFEKWTEERQYESIAEFDIGIMPLSEDPFSRGKSAYKLLQYLSCAVPSVCSPVGMNADIAEGEKYTLCAADFDSFSEKLIQIIENKSIREELGKNGRKFIEDKFSLQTVVANFAEFLKNKLADS